MRGTCTPKLRIPYPLRSFNFEPATHVALAGERNPEPGSGRYRSPGHGGCDTDSCGLSWPVLCVPDLRLRSEIYVRVQYIYIYVYIYTYVSKDIQSLSVYVYIYIYIRYVYIYIYMYNYMYLEDSFCSSQLGRH